MSINWWFTKIRPTQFTCLIATIWLTTTVSAQVIQTHRFEKVLGTFEGNYEVMSAEDKGVFLYRQFQSIEQNALELIFLDTTLQGKWAGFVPLDHDLVIKKDFFLHESLFLLAQYPKTGRNDMEIVSIHQSNGDYLRYSFRNFIPMNITEFKVTGRAAIIGGYFNRIPVVLYYSFAQKKSKVVPGLFNEAGELNQVRVYPDGSFDVLVSARNAEHQQTVIVRNYDAEGDLIKSISLRPDGNRHFFFGQSLKTRDDRQVVVGVYGSRNSYYTKGMFIASIDKSGDQHINYYAYSELENFFKYMRTRREQRVKNRIARRKIKGRGTRFNYRFLVHELVPYHDQFIMLGEAFYPRYIYTDRLASYGGSGYGNNMGYRSGSPYASNRIFDGYYYTHAVVIGFDKAGKLLWDNSFEINDVRTFELEQFVKLDVGTENISLLYIFDHDIRSKIISDNHVLQSKSASPIKLKFEDDKAQKEDTETSHLDYWYDHYLYAYGVQRIASDRALGKPRRKVFFINKVRPGPSTKEE